MRGIFITFEGSEGCGKSTQIERLGHRLQASGLQVLVTREPGGTPIGEQIRHLLKFAPEGRAMKPEAELLLFAASRAQLVREVIAPALDRGVIVLADRFLDSTTVYQGVARKLDPGDVRAINHFAAGTCRPDITFVLDLDPETARHRIMRRPKPVGEVDRMESQPPEFYAAVRDGYLKLAKEEPARFHVIDTTASANDVETAIWTTLEEKFHGLLAGSRV